MLKHQGILHTLFQTREEVDSVNEELFEEVFRDIAPVSEELPEDPFVEVHVFQGGLSGLTHNRFSRSGILFSFVPSNYT